MVDKSSPPPGMSSGELMHMQESGRSHGNHHSAGNFSSEGHGDHGGEGHGSGGHEGLGGTIGDKEGPLAILFGKSFGKMGGSFDEGMISKINQEAALSKIVANQITEQNMSQANLSHEGVVGSGITSLGDLKVESAFGVPSAGNLAGGASGITNVSKGGAGH